MKMFSLSRAAAAAPFLLFTLSAAGDCQPEWDSSIGDPGTTGFVQPIQPFDDGQGEALYIGGWFVFAGTTEVNNIARWDHDTETWSALGAGMNDMVRAMSVFNDGTGSALYAGGLFTEVDGVRANRIARWDGEVWSPVGAGFNNNVYALTVFDDGSGPALYAGGSFTMSGDTSVSRVARWDPETETWLPLGSGAGGTVWGMAVWHDDPSGTSLYVGGSFSSAGDVPGTSGIARWDGESWSALDQGTTAGDPPQVNSVAIYNGEVYIGGFFTEVSGVPGTERIARWDGEQWLSVGGGIADQWVTTLGVFDDGDGEAIYAGGTFSMAGGIFAERIARWDGQSWAALNGSITGFNVIGMGVFDDGSGPDLYVGGSFNQVNGQMANNIAIYRGCLVDKGIPGDLTGDGTVGVPDLLILINSWGACADCGDCPADLTGDCMVGVPDLLILINNWG